MKTLHHKKNEKQEVEFYQDKECTIPFDFTNAKNLYVEFKDGDVTTLTAIHTTLIPCVRNEKFGLYKHPKIYVGYIASGLSFNEPYSKIMTLNEITPNLSKYIPEDNAVLFLNGEKISLIDYDTYYDMFDGYRDIEFEGKIIKGMPYHPQIYGIHRIRDMVYIHKHEYNIDDYTNFSLNILKGKKLTIFLPHGTQSELQKANEVAKELKEKYGVEEVNLFVLHWFYKELYELIQNKNGSYTSVRKYQSINKIITTNSTGILKPEDSKERLQVIDCKEIFEEYLKTER